MAEDYNPFTDELDLTGSSSGGGAPTDATYVVLSADGTLTDERVLSQGANISITDNGAGNTISIAVDSGVTLVNGLRPFTGNVTIGVGAAGTDYALLFDGESNDGSITWMEDENYFQTNAGILVGGSGDSTFGSNLWMQSGKEIRYYETDNTNYTGFKAPTLSADIIYTLPTGDGSSGQAITTNGSKVLGWSSFLNSASIDTSAKLAAIVTDETGSGSLVFATSPVFTTPNIGAATATSIAIGANTLNTSEWANLDGQDQTIATTSSPRFANLTVGSGTTSTSIGTCTISNASPCVVTKTAHGLSVGDCIYFTTTGVLPDSLAPSSPFYIISAGFGVDSFEIADTPGGIALNTSSAGSGTHTLFKQTFITQTFDGTNDSTIVWDSVSKTLNLRTNGAQEFFYSHGVFGQYPASWLVNSVGTAADDTVTAFQCWVRQTTNNNTAGELVGFWGGVYDDDNSTAKSVSLATAMYAYNLFGGTTARTVTEAVGLTAVGAEAGANLTLTTSTGIVARACSSGTPTSTNHYGIHILNTTASPTNNRGLFIDNINSGTNKYAIYSAGGTVYFEGDTVIGNPTALSGRFSVDNDTDKVVCRLQGHSTQTTALLLLENSAATAQVSISNTGIATVYNGLTTVGTGLSPILASVDLTAQSAAIAATTIYAVPSTGAGLYNVSWVATITRAASTSCVLGGTTGFQLTYTDADDSVVKTSNPAAVTAFTSTTNNTATSVSGTFNAYCKASTNLQYAFGYTSVGATSMQYNLHIKVKYLG